MFGSKQLLGVHDQYQSNYSQLPNLSERK